ncbi:uncharacterized protein LOC110069365 [Orbicella faveolata]|uniref:uncharacterized protein LOC110069365 n=1 Tax=Orbicella faveolata TaxID=48498 RepID=UPI0009E3B189|nr:uncharacterized protein LOC110069365 [Orbicella faveolata]
MSYSRNATRGNKSRSLSGEEERILIPKDKVGLVIGRKGRTLQEIRDRTGVQISIKDNHAHLRGTTEQCNNARELIEEILSSAREERNSSQGGFRKLDMVIPERFMGQVIGKGREKLSNIETNTGVALKVIDNNLYIKGSAEKEKKAIREIKAIVNAAIKRSQLAVPVARFVHVDATQLEENHEFELSAAPQLKAVSGEKCFKLKLLEHPLKEETPFTSVEIKSLEEKVLEVLKQIRKEKDEEMVKVDMWCHFGHAYVTKVDEDEERETFTLKDIKEKIKFGDGKSWNPFFKAGVERIKVEQIEKYLTSCAAKEDIRYDFTFFTPSFRGARVKAWLTEEHSQAEGAKAASLAFSRNAPIPVKNILTRVVSDEHAQTENTSNTPCFHICSQFHHRMKVDILIPSKELDCRLSIRTGPNVLKTPEAEEESKILESYLMGMKIEEGQLVLPPVCERPDGFDLFYQRRSLRKTYQYEIDGEQFSLTVCKDQANNVDIDETDVKSFDETPLMV